MKTTICLVQDHPLWISTQKNQNKRGSKTRTPSEQMKTDDIQGALSHYLREWEWTRTKDYTRLHYKEKNGVGRNRELWGLPCGVNWRLQTRIHLETDCNFVHHFSTTLSFLPICMFMIHVWTTSLKIENLFSTIFVSVLFTVTWTSHRSFRSFRSLLCWLEIKHITGNSYAFISPYSSCLPLSQVSLLFLLLAMIQLIILSIHWTLQNPHHLFLPHFLHSLWWRSKRKPQ